MVKFGGSRNMSRLIRSGTVLHSLSLSYWVSISMWSVLYANAEAGSRLCCVLARKIMTIISSVAEKSSKLGLS